MPKQVVDADVFSKPVVTGEYFVSAFANHRAELYERWTRARPANDFGAVAALLARTVEMSREYAGFFAPFDHVADPLIDLADPGVRTASLPCGVSWFSPIRTGPEFRYWHICSSSTSEAAGIVHSPCQSRPSGRTALAVGSHTVMKSTPA